MWGGRIVIGNTVRMYVLPVPACFYSLFVGMVGYWVGVDSVAIGKWKDEEAVLVISLDLPTWCPLLYEQQFVSEASLASLLAATVVRWTHAKLR